MVVCVPNPQQVLGYGGKPAQPGYWTRAARIEPFGTMPRRAQSSTNTWESVSVIE